MKNILIIVFSCLTTYLLGQTRENVLFDLKNADTNIFYTYVFDDYSYCNVKFDPKQNIKDFVFTNQYDANNIDTASYKKHNIRYYSIDKNKSKTGGEITIFLKEKSLFIGGTMKGMENGKTYFYSGKTRKLTTTFETINGLKIGVERSFYENGQVKMERFNDTTILRYKWRRYFYPDGKIEQNIVMKEKYFVDTSYYNNGQISHIDTIDYEYGHIGNYVSYYENGQIKSDVNYREGVLTGNFKYFHPNGKISKEGTYFAGKEDGLVKCYFENGELKRSTDFNFGKKDGLEKIFNEKGELTYEIEYKDGKVISRKKIL